MPDPDDRLAARTAWPRRARRWASALGVACAAAGLGGCGQQQGEWFQGLLLLGALVALDDGARRHDLTIDIEGAGRVQAGDTVYAADTVLSRLRDGAEVELTALPDDDERFESWSGACTGDEVRCIVVMRGDRQVTAQFSGADVAPMPRSLTLIVEGPGSILYSGGVYEDTQVLDNIADGVTVSLRASATETNASRDWGGACEGVAEAICELVMDQDRTVRLRFTAPGSGARAAAGLRAELSDGDIRVRWRREPADSYRLNAATSGSAGDFVAVAGDIPARAGEVRLALEPRTAAWLNRVYLLETCAGGRCRPALQASAALAWPTASRTAFRAEANAVWAAARRGEWLALARYAARAGGGVDGRLFVYRLDGAAWRLAPPKTGVALENIASSTPAGTLRIAEGAVAVDWPGQPARLHPLAR